MVNLWFFVSIHVRYFSGDLLYICDWNNSFSVADQDQESILVCAAYVLSVSPLFDYVCLTPVFKQVCSYMWITSGPSPSLCVCACTCVFTVSSFIQHTFSIFPKRILVWLTHYQRVLAIFSSDTKFVVSNICTSVIHILTIKVYWECLFGCYFLQPFGVGHCTEMFHRSTSQSVTETVV